jgi:hypothetical protein
MESEGIYKENSCSKLFHPSTAGWFLAELLNFSALSAGRRGEKKIRKRYEELIY